MNSPRNEPAPQSEEEWWQEETKWKNRMGDIARQHCTQAESAGSEPGAADAIAFLKGMPTASAIKKAREWTGRTDIASLEDAITAVREALQE